uniref:Uncharacterized protein n=2 Tax=Leptocylindrus danicus TaxID=163516 RepID=A0A7S2LI66_9STRA|mmetsp:Transcript_5415/g.7947  ORF Transcript_5415/g.7947 Transcript_5415/m.7947 type:complete len:970 (+) Transcript_5415:237-3146(+)|eukprot:CAMPEP_0116033668 /NCGR_PEP_ID=MMETSP0321-20121206/19137_1 /TAXON_ID=163516 /ORGANISM="Leptocylindrus danicus var. danicus, Strain B650" /LENGTH=969 /DNA_ID=CAMNT_0003509809 /DNA_START=192 /DNA_END=3101 /DNA_ORIENTATION=+
MNSVAASGETGSGSSSFQKKKFGKNLNSKLTKPPDAKDNRRAPSGGRSHGGLHLLGSSNKRSSTLLSKLAAPRPLNTPSLRSESISSDREHNASGVQLTAVTSQGSVWASGENAKPKLTSTSTSAASVTVAAAADPPSLIGGHARGGASGVNLKAVIDSATTSGVQKLSLQRTSSASSLRNTTVTNGARSATLTSSSAATNSNSNSNVKQKWRADSSNNTGNEVMEQPKPASAEECIHRPMNGSRPHYDSNINNNNKGNARIPSQIAMRPPDDIPRNINIQNNTNINDKAPDEDQMQIMAKLAKQKAQAKRLEEEQRQREQRERADVRLKELESKLQNHPPKTSSPDFMAVPTQIQIGSTNHYHKTAQQQQQHTVKAMTRQLYEPNTATMTAHTISEPPTQTPTQQPQPQTQLIHLTDYEDRSRRSTNGHINSHNTGSGSGRMLFDPKSGSLVDASKVSSSSSSKHDAGVHGNVTKRERRRTKQHQQQQNVQNEDPDVNATMNSSGSNNRRGKKSSSASTFRSTKSTKNHSTHHTTTTNSKRALPRTLGVLYKYDTNTSSNSSVVVVQCADGCDADMGYGAHTVPGGRVRNVQGYNLYQEQQQQGKLMAMNGTTTTTSATATTCSPRQPRRGHASTVVHAHLDSMNYNHNAPPLMPTSALSLQHTQQATAAYHVSSMSKNIVKLSVNDTPESPTLQASAAPWQPPSMDLHVPPPPAAAAANDVSNANPIVANFGRDDVGGASPALAGLGFDPTRNTTSLITSPDFHSTGYPSASDQEDDADLDLVPALSHDVMDAILLTGADDDDEDNGEEDVDGVDAHFAILGSPSRLLGLTSASSSSAVSQHHHNGGASSTVWNRGTSNAVENAGSSASSASAAVTSSSLLGMSMGLNWDILSSGAGDASPEASTVTGAAATATPFMSSQASMSSKPWESGAFGGFGGGSSLLGHHHTGLAATDAHSQHHSQQHKPS